MLFYFFCNFAELSGLDYRLDFEAEPRIIKGKTLPHFVSGKTVSDLLWEFQVGFRRSVDKDSLREIWKGKVFHAVIKQPEVGAHTWILDNSTSRVKVPRYNNMTTQLSSLIFQTIYFSQALPRVRRTSRLLTYMTLSDFKFQKKLKWIFFLFA